MWQGLREEKSKAFELLDALTRSGTCTPKSRTSKPKLKGFSGTKWHLHRENYDNKTAKHKHTGFSGPQVGTSNQNSMTRQPKRKRVLGASCCSGVAVAFHCSTHPPHT
eukprot:600331-Rhodomonas_salina.1